MSPQQTHTLAPGRVHAHPETLVGVSTVRESLGKPGIRLVEVDVDPSLYAKGHLEGAVGWSWETDLCDPVRRDLLGPDGFARLCSRAGIANDTTVILYGDANNWFACWAFWQFKVYGHEDVRLMNGGRTKWERDGMPYTTDLPEIEETSYAAGDPDPSLRAFRPEVEDVVRKGGTNLVDVRSPDEYTGKLIAPPGLPETAQRGGHIPGAVNVPWSLAVQDDGTFKPLDELRDLYEGTGVDPGRNTIAYCRIGERSAHTWFVLRCLLGYENVKNYDGSWTEWGNLVGAPVER